jgi:hypothetical protein
MNWKHTFSLAAVTLAACLPAAAQRESRYDDSLVPQVGSISGTSAIRRST